MQGSECNEAFVEENGKTAIVTVRDILNVRNITTTKISNIMHYVPRLNPNNTVGDAANLMFVHRIRSLPVYENSHLKGQITSRSIAKKLMETDHSVRVSNLMTPNPIHLASSDEVSKARRIMIRRRIDQIPILRSGRLHRVITSNAIAFNLLPSTDRNVKGDWRGSRFDVPVDDFAPPEISSNGIRDSPREVFQNMVSNNTHYSVILNFDEIQGIMTYRDFMKLIPQGQSRKQTTPLYIVGLPEDPF